MNKKKGAKALQHSSIGIEAYSSIALPHLEDILNLNTKTMKIVSDRLVGDVKRGKSLFAFGSGHSALLTMEIYHRAGGPSFMIPILSDSLLPSAGPKWVRLMERTPQSAKVLLNRANPRSGEMIWLVSQSGINPTIVEMAYAAKERGLFTVAFTSTTHSRSVESRHSSGKRLFEVCDEVMDLGGVPGDAAVKVSNEVFIGPLSTLSGIFLAHSILCSAMAQLERDKIRCSYTSVNTPRGEKLNRALELQASQRDALLK